MVWIVEASTKLFRIAGSQPAAWVPGKNVANAGAVLVIIAHRKNHPTYD
jgi:hypothetical protein